VDKKASELRYNYLLDTWVVIAPERKNRPHDFSASPATESKDLSLCPFEPVNISHGIFTLKGEGSVWKVKVIPNKYPLLRKENPTGKEKRGLYEVLNGFGVHEVVVDTPDHFKPLRDFSVAELKDLLFVYKKRMEELYSDGRIRYVLVFKNYKREAGASIFHPHSQVVAMPIIPTTVKKTLEQGRRYYLKKGKCYLCDELNFELKERKRLIYENEFFVAYCPFYSLFPFQVRIISKFHSHNFLNLEVKLLEGLSDALLNVLRRLYSKANDPPYNFYIHSSPSPFSRYEPFFHWYVELVPRLTVPGGFEIGSGFHVNPVPPEEAASLLRSDDLPDGNRCCDGDVE